MRQEPLNLKAVKEKGSQRDRLLYLAARWRLGGWDAGLRQAGFHPAEVMRACRTAAAPG